ncbi:hypothetical protein PUN4_150021 [Paraburkholderia unamae]|nr:hypothetical protein PUN4_150021 [Paraburkholderia unamae]
MCASVLWGWVAHSFVADEERIVKCAKTFASEENCFANVPGGSLALPIAF